MTIEDRAVIEEQVLPLLGTTVTLVASPEGAHLRLATGAEQAVASSSSNGVASVSIDSSNGLPSAAAPLSVAKATSPRVIPLLDCTSSLGGAKAAACAQLDQVGCWGGDVDCLCRYLDGTSHR